MQGAMTVALMITCLTDTWFPRVGEALTRVLRHFGCRVEFPPGQTCCGQAAFNSGFQAEARAVARRLLTIFEPYYHVVTPSASCAMMLRCHLVELFEHDPRLRRAAERRAAGTHEFMTFLREHLGVKPEDHLHWSEPVTFHYPCHARGLYSPADLQAALGGAGPAPRPPGQVELCCGFGGMFAVDLPRLSGAMLRDRLHDLAATGVRTVICNEGGCALQLEGGARRLGLPLRCKHVAECLAESLGLMEAT
jgi:L-lactate dehydrogenase complex protein LldE